MQKKTMDLVAQLKHCRTLPEIREVCSAVRDEAARRDMLIEVLGSGEISIRWKAGVALTEMGPSVVNDLIGCLSDQQASVRSSAAWILGNIGDGRAAELRTDAC